MRIPAVLLACGLALGAYTLNASSQTAALPDGWSISGEAPKLFAGEIDMDDSPSGKGSAVMRRTETSHPYGSANLLQGISPEPYAGKRVRLRAHVRFLGDANRGGGKVWIAPNNGAYSQSNKGFSHEWTWYEATVTFPAKLEKLAIGVSFKGPGSAKVDVIQLEVLGDAPADQQATQIDDIVQHEDKLPRATP
jgi:hypothetical protein